jgi:hypothetical protein
MDLHSQLAAPVFALGYMMEAETAAQGAQGAQAQVSIQHWSKADGTPYIPFFSQLDFLHQIASDDQPFLQMSARDLLAMTTGSLLIVNPNSDLAQELTPEMVTQMLAMSPQAEPVDAPPSSTSDTLKKAGTKLRGMLGLKKR